MALVTFFPPERRPGEHFVTWPKHDLVAMAARREIRPERCQDVFLELNWKGAARVRDGGTLPSSVPRQEHSLGFSHVDEVQENINGAGTANVDSLIKIQHFSACEIQ